jgi:hypothetical protein
MSIAQDLANALHRFNAKERNHLMRFALLGAITPDPPRQSSQWIHENFFNSLKLALADDSAEGVAYSPIVLSDQAHCVYAAMDYHLDWLHGALWCTKNQWQRGSYESFVPVARIPEPGSAAGDVARPQHDVMGNQEDVDLLVVIEDEAMTYLVLIEAKGDSSFSRAQLASKLERLRLIVGSEHAPLEDQLRFALVLLAPSKSQLGLGGSKTYAELAEHPTRASEPTYTALSTPLPRLSNAIIRMTMSNYPAPLDLITRCDSRGTNPDGALLTHWKIAPR